MTEYAGYIGEVRFGDVDTLGLLTSGEWLVRVNPDGTWKAVRVDFEKVSVPASTLVF